MTSASLLFYLGIDILQATMRNGQRCSAAKAYLVPAGDRKNLDIVTKAFVTKIIISNKRAVAVEFEFEGRTYTVSARREVIVSAGTVNTAKILMLSGIGPKEHLEKMKIPVVANLNVGGNYHDHCGTPIVYTLDEMRPYSGRMSDKDNIEQYIYNRTGDLTNPSGGSNIALLSKDGPDATAGAFPVHELMFFEGVALGSIGTLENLLEPIINKSVVFCLSTILHPRSRGSVTLKSNDPHAMPIIQANYLEKDSDLKDIVDGLKQCKQILDTGEVKKLGAIPFPALFPTCLVFYPINITRYFECCARAIAIPIFHGVGTARMGNPANKSTTVVTPELRVIGIDGLRVVDASVMPIIPNGNTNVPTIMVAEKASDIIKKTIDCTENGAKPLRVSHTQCT